MSEAAGENAGQADKRRRILDAALRVFAERGVHGTPVPPVAREAGVGVGTLYRYFDNKESLVNAVFRETKRELRARLLDDLDANLSASVLFDRIWERLVTFVEERPEAFRFLELQDHDSYLDAESRAVEASLLAPLGEFVRAGQQRGDLSPSLRPDVAMALFWGAFVGLFKARRLGYVKLRQEDIDAARRACRSVLFAVPPQGGGPDRQSE